MLISFVLVGRSEDWSIRLGGFAGIAYYDRLSQLLSAPNIEGYMPIAGLTAIARYQEQTDFRFTLLPAGAGVDAIVNFSVAQRF